MPIIPGGVISNETSRIFAMRWRRRSSGGGGGGSGGGGSGWPPYLTFSADFITGTYMARPAAASGDMTVVTYSDFMTMLTDLGGSFARASSAYGFDSSGVYGSFPNDELRISHYYNPASGAFEPAGLLNEPTVYNYLLQTVDLTAADWINSGVTVTALGPQEHGQPVHGLSGGGTIEQSYVGMVSSRNYTISAMVRGDGSPETRIAYLDTGIDVGGVNIQWNADGSIAGTTGELPAYVVEVGFGYHWVSITKKTGASATSVGVRITPDTSGGSGSFLVWGLSLQNSNYATSWMPTTTGTVQRKNDNLTIPFTGFGSTAAGTLLIEAQWLPSSIQYSGKRMSGGVFNSSNWSKDRLSFDNGYSSTGRLYAYSDTVLILNTYPATQDGNIHKMAASWQTDHYQHCVDGVTIGEALSGAAPIGLDIMGIGGNSYGGYNLGGFVRRVDYYISPIFGADLNAATA